MKCLGKVAYNTQIYDIRRFVRKDIFFDTLLFSVIHFILSLGQFDFDRNHNGSLKWGSSLISCYIYFYYIFNPTINISGFLNA